MQLTEKPVRAQLAFARALISKDHTRDDAAERLGISRGYVSHLLMGSRTPGNGTLRKITDVYRVRVADWVIVVGQRERAELRELIDIIPRARTRGERDYHWMARRIDSCAGRAQS